MIWTTSTLSDALGITINFQIFAGKIQFNSNAVQENDLFIALPGQRDGHDYIAQALAQGASVVIASKKVHGVAPHKIIIVDDTLSALHKLAVYKRRKSTATFIAITGSVGKTSTKEALNTVLSSFDPVFASRSNFNNYLGVLINLASMSDQVKYAIFEVGMNHPGEIRALTNILQPHIAIITNISEAHLANFTSMRALLEAKCEIFEGLPGDGVAIINADNQSLQDTDSCLNKISITNIYHCIESAKLSSYYDLGLEVHLAYLINDKKLEVTRSLIPKHHAQNFAIALLVSDILGKDLYQAVLQLKNISLIEDRGNIVDIQKNGNNYKFICDYYNSSPESLKAALRYLQQIDHRKKIVIIGEMLELGDNSSRLHRDLVPDIIGSGCEKILLVGALTKNIFNELPATIEKIYFDNVDSLIANLDALLDNDALVLIKGSRGVKLDKILAYYKN